jgi:SAM-dependent methyltransferase
MRRCISCNTTLGETSWNCSNCGYHPIQHEHWLSFVTSNEGELEGFESGFFDALKQIEDGHYWFEARNHIIISMLRRFFPTAQSFLEIGCGTGFVLQGIAKAIPSLALTGGELFANGLHYAHQRLPTIPLYQLDATALPFVESFDVIGAFDVLEHIEKDQDALVEIAKAVKPGGGLILSVPQHPWLWSSLDAFSHHFRRYQRQELSMKVERTGLNVVFTTSFVSLLLPLMIISRLRAPKDVDKIDIFTEHRLSSILNSSLSAVLQLERGMIELGIRLPVGGSRLVVARKPM